MHFWAIHLNCIVQVPGDGTLKEPNVILHSFIVNEHVALKKTKCRCLHLHISQSIISKMEHNSQKHIQINKNVNRHEQIGFVALCTKALQDMESIVKCWQGFLRRCSQANISTVKLTCLCEIKSPRLGTFCVS